MMNFEEIPGFGQMLVALIALLLFGALALIGVGWVVWLAWFVVSGLPWMPA